MSYEGGGGIGPAGPTGATGATGSIDFSGPTASILWYDGSGVTGTETFKWRNGEIYGYTIEGGPNGNSIMIDDGAGSMRMSINQTDAGQSILLSGGNTTITLTDAISGETGVTGTLEIVIGADSGIAGQYLGSDGTGKVTWSSPEPSNWAGYVASTNVDMQNFNLFSTFGDSTNTFTLAGDSSLNSELTVQGDLLLKGGLDSGNVTLENFSGSTVVLDASGNIELNAYSNNHLKVLTNGATGTSGQYLGSDGSGKVIWSTPTPVYTVSAYGQTGATGPLINNGPTGTQLMTTSITTGVAGHILGQVSIQIQNSNPAEHPVGVYLTVNGSTSGTTTHTIPKAQGGLDGSANLTVFHRTSAKDPPGTYNISVYGYSNTATGVFYDHIDLVGLGNLDGP